MPDSTLVAESALKREKTLIGILRLCEVELRQNIRELEARSVTTTEIRQQTSTVRVHL